MIMENIIQVQGEPYRTDMNEFSIETLVRARRYCYLESNLGDAE